MSFKEAYEASEIMTYHRDEVERAKVLLKKAGFHVLSRGQVKKLAVSKAVRLQLLYRITDDAELTRFMDYSDRSAGDAMGHEMLQAGMITRTEHPTSFSDYTKTYEYTAFVVPQEHLWTP